MIKSLLFRINFKSTISTFNNHFSMSSSYRQEDNENNFLNVFTHLIEKNKENDKQIRISVEGNIASGKSTILKYLEKTFGNKRQINQKIVKVYPEPIDKWCDLNGTNLLDLLYKDPYRWSFTVQSYIQLTMLNQHLKDYDNRSLIKIIERSLFSAKYCFVENLYQSCLLKQSEYDILSKWFEFICATNNCDLDLIFYLRTNPEICYERTKFRNRSEEVSNITLKYLQNLHDLHEAWLVNSNTHKTPYYKPAVILIDANQSIDDVCKRVYKEANALFR